MTDEFKVICLATYKARKRVDPFDPSTFLCGCELDGYGSLTFAHVLNIPATQVVWPGDAAELFFPDLFSRRLSDDWFYVLDNPVAEHMRCETLRLCNSNFFRNTNYFESDLDRCNVDSSFLDTLFGDDGDDEDTLSSELLLTQEYELPKGH